MIYDFLLENDNIFVQNDNDNIFNCLDFKLKSCIIYLGAYYISRRNRIGDISIQDDSFHFLDFYIFAEHII